MVRLRLSVLLLLLFGSVAVWAEDAPAPATQEVASEDGKVRMRVPASWKLEEVRRSPAELLSFQFSVPGAKETLRLTVFNLPGVELTPKAQMHLERPAQMRMFAASSSEVAVEPLPHLVVSFKKDDMEGIAIFAFRRLRGRGIHIRLMGPAEAVVARKERFLVLAQSVTCDLDPWPSPIEGYETVERKGVHYKLGKGVKASQLKAIAKVVAQTTKSFRSQHGPIERSDDEVLTVVVHDRKADAEALNKSAAKNGFWVDHQKRRVFALPLDKDKRDGHGALASQLTYLFLHERYPTVFPTWVLLAEQWMASNHAISRKKGPQISKSFEYYLEPLKHSLDELAPVEKSDWGAYVQHARLYGLYLRHGPKRVRKTYEHFLADSLKTGDSAQAMKEHLVPLANDGAFMAAVHTFAKKKTKVFETKP